MKAIYCILLAFAFAFKAFSTITLYVDAGLLADASGVPMPTTGLVILVASTTDSTFAPPTPSAFVSEDDMIVAKWDLTGLGEEGMLQGIATNLTLSGNWGSPDPLQLYWFPTLTLSATAPGYGTPFGQYRDGIGIDGSTPWITPSDGSTVNFKFLTVELGGSNPSAAGLASLATPRADTILTVASSANPSPTGADVTLTATVTALPSGAGTPTGSVQFKSDGSPLGAPAVMSGGVAQLSTASLAHGFRAISAEYAGDASFNGTSNTLLGAQVINTAPVPGTHTLSTLQNTTVVVSTAKLLVGASDADEDVLSITAVTDTSANGGNVSLSSGTLTYTPATDHVGLDSFTFSLSDGYTSVDGTVIVTVRSHAQSSQNLFPPTSLPDGNKQITFAGIPGRSYNVQATSDLVEASWETIGTILAGPNGLAVFTDLSATNYPSRYYRTVAP